MRTNLILLLFCASLFGKGNNISLSAGFPDFDLIYERDLGRFSIAAQPGLLHFLSTQSDPLPAFLPALYLGVRLHHWKLLDLRSDFAAAYSYRPDRLSGWTLPGNTGNYIQAKADRLYMGPRIGIRTVMRKATFSFKLGFLVTWRNYFLTVDGKNQDQLLKYDGVLPSIAAGFGYDF